MKPVAAVSLLVASLTLCSACGGGGGEGSPNVIVPTPIPSATPTPGAPNAAAINVNLGPKGNYLNGVFTSATVCVPGTATCQTIGAVLVDTGSFGLRINGSALTIPLPQQTQGASPVGECALFASGFTWGSVTMADVQIAGEIARNVPTQIVSPPGFPSVPAGCGSGLPPLNILTSLGANGILGIGEFAPDCGPACATPGPGNPGFYYTCPSSTCSVTAENVAAQVQNPVPLFAADNNGVMVSLPAIGPNGAPNAAGALTFGIGTESNNGLGGAQVFTINALGNITTIFKGTSYGDSFLDTGSNGLFFLSSAVTGITGCSDSGFYCPGTTLALSAQQMGASGHLGTVDFSIANADGLISTHNAAFNNIGAPNPGAFDWGLPFFFGRSVFVAIDGQATPAGPGPYWAY